MHDIRILMSKMVYSLTCYTVLKVIHRRRLHVSGRPIQGQKAPRCETRGVGMPGCPLASQLEGLGSVVSTTSGEFFLFYGFLSSNERTTTKLVFGTFWKYHVQTEKYHVQTKYSKN